MSTHARRPLQDKVIQAVSQQMARLDVSGLPRNYELFYEAFTGSDPALAREVLNLPAMPPQGLLDDIGTRYQLSGFVALTVPPTRDPDIRLLSSLREKMASGVEQKKGFTRVLEAVARSLREDSNAGPGDILAEIEYLSVSLSDAVVAETELEAALRSGAKQLADAQREASAVRALMLRDRVTGLPNHAALAERLEALYAADAKALDTALILVTISDLAELVDAYGEASAFRIVKKAAGIFRKAIKKNDFLARTGKADFAFLFHDVTRDSIKPIADRLITAIADNLVFATSNGPSSIRLAIGAALQSEAFSPQQWRQHASFAAETARASARTSVVVHGEG